MCFFSTIGDAHEVASGSISGGSRTGGSNAGGSGAHRAASGSTMGGSGTGAGGSNAGGSGIGADGFDAELASAVDLPAASGSALPVSIEAKKAKKNTNKLVIIIIYTLEAV